jgi:RNA polymerase sigma-70 factor, ECF subfamily
LSYLGITTNFEHQQKPASIKYIMPTEKKLTDEFEKIKPQLKSFLLRMTASVEDTEDLVQETFIKSFQNIQTFKGNSSLKTWIFAIASNLCKNFLRSKKLWPENATDISKEAALKSPELLGKMMEIRTTSPQGDFEIREHIAFCFSCIGKSLPIEQQVALLLKEIYEFKVQEIAEILELTTGVVKHLLHSSRQKMTEIFDNRCSLVSKLGFCHQCSELNGLFNPKQELQKELMKIEMVKDQDSKSKEALFDLRMEIVRGIDPYNSGASELQLFHLKHSKQTMDKFLENNP